MINNKYYQKHNTDSNKKLLSTFEKALGEEKLVVAYILANNYYLENKLTEAIPFYKYVIEQLDILNKADFDILDVLIVSCDNLAEIYENTENFKESVEYRMRVMQIAGNVLENDCTEDVEKLFDLVYERNLSNLSSTLLDLEDYESLIDIHSAAIQLYKKINNKRNCDAQLAENYYCLAQSYSFIDDFENSLINAYEAADYYEKIGVSDNLHYASYLGDCYKIIAQGFDSTSDYDNMVKYLEKAIEYYDMLAEINQEEYGVLLATTYMFAASMIEAYDKLDEAKSYLKKAIEVYKCADLADDDEFEALTNIYFRLSMILFKTMDDDFIAYADKTSEMIDTLIYERNKSADELRLPQFFLYQALKEYYVNHSNFEKADYYDSLLEPLITK